LIQTVLIQPNSAPDASTAQRVQREQVAALFAISWSSTLADTLIAWALGGLFYWRLRDPMVVLWLGLHLVQVLRYPLMSAYYRDPNAAQRNDFWARRNWQELLWYSATWGLAPWLFMPVDNLPMTSLMMLVMLGIASAGVPAVAPRWASVLAFVVPMLVGLITAMAWRGDVEHLFLAACCVLYLGATLHFAHQQHHLLTHALKMRFEKEALADKLAIQMAATQYASEEKTRFFAAANHDLRQPLQAIALFGAVLDKELQNRPEHAHAAKLLSAAHNMGVSLDAMLDASQLDAGVIEPKLQALALTPIFQELNALFAPRAEAKGLQLRLRASPLWVHTDAHLLHRLLANLLDNAIKYTAQGGVLVVARLRAGSVWVDVADTGVGLAPEHLEHIFEEFYQISNPSRDRSQGLGMGLAIVRRLAALLKAPISVQSRPGHGSRFRVQLPTALASCLPLVASRPLLIERRALPARVLLVDDEADVALGMAAVLGAVGVSTAVVADEAQATALLTQAESDNAPFDALVCDFRLAEGRNGLELGLHLCQRFGPGLKLLMLTGETAPERLQQVHDTGVPVLFKPVEATALLKALTALHRKP